MHTLTRICTFVLGCLLFSAAPCLGADIGRVIALSPGVKVERGAQTLPLALKDAVQLGDTIITDASGKAQIIFNDDSTVTLGNNSNLNMREFADTGSKPVFKAHLGQGLARIITGKVVEQNPLGFGVSTPEATVGIRGTVLTVSSEQGSTTVFVENTLRKEVYVNNTQVQQGDKAIVSSPGEAPYIQPITSQDQQQIDEGSSVGSSTAAENPDLSTLPASSAGPNTDLADVNLPQQNLGDNMDSNMGNSIIATVSGSLNSSIMTGFTGSFAFTANLDSGVISSGSMVGGGSDTRHAGSFSGFNLAGGSGLVSGNTFTVNNFSPSGQGLAAYGGPIFATDDMVQGGTSLGVGNPSATQMDGTISVSGSNVSVSGSYTTDFGGGWNAGTGTFSGNN